MSDQAKEIHALFQGVPQTTEFKKRRKHIVRVTREAIDTYCIIQVTPEVPKPNWLVCLSAGYVGGLIMLSRTGH